MSSPYSERPPPAGEYREHSDGGSTKRHSERGPEQRLVQRPVHQVLIGRPPSQFAPTGTRYSVYFFKNYDRRWDAVKPHTDDFEIVYDGQTPVETVPDENTLIFNRSNIIMKLLPE